MIVIRVTLFACLLMLFRCAAWAGSFDVCYSKGNTRIDGNSVTIVAPIYPAGTLTSQDAATDCNLIAAPPIGTMYLVGNNVIGLDPDPTDTMFATISFYISRSACHFSPCSSTDLVQGDILTVIGRLKSGTGRHSRLPVAGDVGLGLATGDFARVTNLGPNAFEVDF